MRASSIFKSRWLALLWAAGILWFAYDFAGSAPEPQDQANATANAAGAPASTDEEKTAVNALGG